MVVNFTNNPANGCKNTLSQEYCSGKGSPQDYGGLDSTVSVTALGNDQ
jgi:hypothetical protein